MTSAARHALAAWAHERDATVVEDRIFRDLRFEGTAPPPLYGLLAPGRRFLVGSVSKSFMTGLRVGFLVADRPVVDELLPYKRSMDLGGPSLVQAVAATFLDDGYAKHLERLRPRYRGRRDAAIAALEGALPAGARFTRPEGGFQLWITLPDGLSAIEVFLRGIERGVAVSPGPAYDVDGRYASCLRLGYGNAPEPEVREGVRRLVDAGSPV
jgi:DNA-binding transcriptional MocR family regulator